jgi:hypothetical protein
MQRRSLFFGMIVCAWVGAEAFSKEQLLSASLLKRVASLCLVHAAPKQEALQILQTGVIQSKWSQLYPELSSREEMFSEMAKTLDKPNHERHTTREIILSQLHQQWTATRRRAASREIFLEESHQRYGSIYLQLLETEEKAIAAKYWERQLQGMAIVTFILDPKVLDEAKERVRHISRGWNYGEFDHACSYKPEEWKEERMELFFESLQRQSPRAGLMRHNELLIEDRLDIRNSLRGVIVSNKWVHSMFKEALLQYPHIPVHMQKPI